MLWRTQIERSSFLRVKYSEKGQHAYGEGDLRGEHREVAFLGNIKARRQGLELEFEVFREAQRHIGCQLNRAGWKREVQELLPPFDNGCGRAECGRVEGCLPNASPISIKTAQLTYY